MLFDLDAFKPQSAKFRFLSRGFDIRRLPQDYAWEMAVLFHTPGIAPRHICLWMGWTQRFWDVHLRKLVISSVDDVGVRAAARANEASIGLEDGKGHAAGADSVWERLERDASRSDHVVHGHVSRSGHERPPDW